MDEAQILIARGIRLAVVREQYNAGNLTEDEASELLRGPLMPGDEATIFDDSAVLKLKPWAKEW